MTAKPKKTSELKSQRKEDGTRHHDFPHVQEIGDNLSILEGIRERKGGVNILIHSLNVLRVSGIENLVSSLKYLLQHVHCN